LFENKVRIALPLQIRVFSEQKANSLCTSNQNKYHIFNDNESHIQETLDDCRIQQT